MNTYLLHYGVKGMKWGENIFGQDEDELAKRTMRGEFGNGEERKRQLGEHYSQIQSRVNQLMKNSSPQNSQLDDLAYKVISGQYGNGAERQKLLGDQYKEVQARVNEILKNQETVQKLISGTLSDISNSTKNLGKQEAIKIVDDKGEEMIDVPAPGIEKEEMVDVPAPGIDSEAKAKENEELKNQLREEIKKELLAE